jgi:alkanesulfonate monooxygenase SsuD/methylene tetrahydromethanopterin reductase-like flavin-dependent oxidoreductase (luciferase family)
VIAALNVIAADSSDDAQQQLMRAMRFRVAAFLAPGRDISDAEADELVASRAGAHIRQMVKYAAVGTPDDVRQYVEYFREHADADELMVAHQSPTAGERLRSVELLAQAVGGLGPATVAIDAS